MMILERRVADRVCVETCRSSWVSLPRKRRSAALPVNHCPHLSRFAEFLQHQQVGLAGLHWHVSDLLTTYRKQRSEQQSVHGGFRRVSCSTRRTIESCYGAVSHLPPMVATKAVCVALVVVVATAAGCGLCPPTYDFQ